MSFQDKRKQVKGQSKVNDFQIYFDAKSVKLRGGKEDFN